ncbi:MULTISPECIES: ribbon-helix-helix domain-containing protein [Gluconobacter]|uniref:ribbon-helix-helix domain-containing protein n=1 Tax=Gluconobacter TaxID=441 RepID=UPI001C052147|nr:MULTISPECIES: ribbon-helix-helix domain-containing protein [Gluconobacter]
MSDLVKRSLSLSGHRTSVALEPEFWTVLDAMAAVRQQSFASLVASLDAARPPERPLASALRVAALTHLQKSVQTAG